MATAIAVLDNRRESKSGKYPIKIRVNNGDEQKYIKVGYRVEEKNWTGSEVNRLSDAGIINGVISEKLNQAKRYIADCQIQGKPLRVKLIESGHTSHSFTEYLNHRAAQYRGKQKIVMARKVKRFAVELTDCFKRDVLFDDIDQDALRELENYLINTRKNVENTRHKKFKFLRQFFEQAIDDRKANGPNPFKKYIIPKKPVTNGKLTKKEIAAMENIDLAPGVLNNVRNMFLFSYYAKGTRFENCLTLLRSQIKAGRVHVKTNKGGSL